MMILEESTNPIAVDLAHSALLMGVVASLKPDRVLELGFGAGQTARAILEALTWNGKGTLTIVDNWTDWQGVEPIDVQHFRNSGVEVVISSEESFVRAVPDATYDVLVSDADHERSDQWLTDHFRIVRPGGFLFFHDTANQTFPNLRSIVERVRARGLPHYHFTANSRPDEQCKRGWLMVIKPLEDA